MRRSSHSLVIAAILAVFVAAGPLSLLAGEADDSAHAQVLGGNDPSIADITEKAMPSVVNISSTMPVANRVSPFYSDPFFGGQDQGQDQKRYAQSLGSGVIVSTKGYILTNNHVVANATKIQVSLSDGRELKAKLVGADPKSDVAVLKLEGNVKDLQPIRFGDAGKMRLGDVVLAIGNPFGVGQTVTMGIVSAKGRGNMGIVDYEDFIQTDAAINPGNSGGALINMHGELVGINTAMLSHSGGYEGIGFAIPTSMAKPIMDSLISKGRVVRGYMGVGIQDVNDELADSLDLKVKKGVLVTQVADGSPAAKAGIKRDDVIVKLDARTTTSAASLRTAIANAGAKKAVQLELYRGGDKKSVTVQLAEQPAEEMVAGGNGRGAGNSGVATGVGVKVKPLDARARARLELPESLDYGVIVTEVDQSGRLGQYLQPGDVILELNRTKLTSAKQLAQLYKKAKEKIAMRVYREGMAAYLVFTK